MKPIEQHRDKMQKDKTKQKDRLTVRLNKIKIKRQIEKTQKV